MKSENLQGVFGVCSSQATNSSQRSIDNCSMTTDGKYLYLYKSSAQERVMQKIGSGEHGTIAGKVYKARPATDIGEITWTFCRNKLYTRRVDD